MGLRPRSEVPWAGTGRRTSSGKPGRPGADCSGRAAAFRPARRCLAVRIARTASNRFMTGRMRLWPSWHRPFGRARRRSPAVGSEWKRWRCRETGCRSSGGPKRKSGSRGDAPLADPEPQLPDPRTPNSLIIRISSRLGVRAIRGQTGPYCRNNVAPYRGAGGSRSPEGGQGGQDGPGNARGRASQRRTPGNGVEVCRMAAGWAAPNLQEKAVRTGRGPLGPPSASQLPHNIRASP